MTDSEFTITLASPAGIQLDHDAEPSPESWHTVARSDLPYPIMVRLGKAPDGRLVISGMAVGLDAPVEVTARSLRVIPLASILTTLARSRFMPLVIQNTISQARQPVRRGPRGLTDAHFEEVATTYRQALMEAPRSPLVAFRLLMPSSESTARRWIQRARDRGLLGPALSGKAGEGPRNERSKS